MSSKIVTPFAPLKEETVQLEYDGNYVELEGFGRCLDGNAGYWYKILGHNNQELLMARNEDISGSHLWEGCTHPEATRAAAKLTEETGFSQVCYALSGSVANDNAIKAAFLYHRAKGREKRDIVVSLHGCYHGNTELLCHISGYDYDFFLPERDISRKIMPPYMTKSEKESIERARNLSCLIKQEGLEERIAAFIYEPIMGIRGAVQLPEIYLREIHNICDEHDIVTIGDEVATGFGRTGMMFAYEHTGIKPDIMTIGKAFTNGEYPLSATLLSKKIAEALEELQEKKPQNLVYIFGNTLAGLPAGCLVAQKVLEILKRDNYLAQVQDKGEYALTLLKGLSSLPNVREVRGKGLMIAVDSRSSHLAEKSQKEMRKRKIHLIPEGRMIMFMPPFTITKEEIEYFGENLEEVLMAP